MNCYQQTTNQGRSTFLSEGPQLFSRSLRRWKCHATTRVFAF